MRPLSRVSGLWCMCISSFEVKKTRYPSTPPRRCQGVGDGERGAALAISAAAEATTEYLPQQAESTLFNFLLLEDFCHCHPETAHTVEMEHDMERTTAQALNYFTV